MGDLTCELNGVKYLMMEIMYSNSWQKDFFYQKMKDHNCIYKGIKEIKPDGWWENGYTIINVLVPEDKVQAFSVAITVK